MNQDVKVLSWIDIILGTWLIVAPFVLTYPSMVAVWNSIIVGALVIILAGIHAANPTRAPGLNWITAILGVWVIAAPFVLHMASTTSTRWNDIVIGAAIVVFSVWSALTTPARTA